jgi:hypothetical protein
VTSAIHCSTWVCSGAIASTEAAAALHLAKEVPLPRICKSSAEDEAQATNDWEVLDASSNALACVDAVSEADHILLVATPARGMPTAGHTLRLQLQTTSQLPSFDTNAFFGTSAKPSSQSAGAASTPLQAEQPAPSKAHAPSSGPALHARAQTGEGKTDQQCLGAARAQAENAAHSTQVAAALPAALVSDPVETVSDAHGASSLGMVSGTLTARLLASSQRNTAASTRSVALCDVKVSGQACVAVCAAVALTPREVKTAADQVHEADAGVQTATLGQEPSKQVAVPALLMWIVHTRDLEQGHWSSAHERGAQACGAAKRPRASGDGSGFDAARSAADDAGEQPEHASVVPAEQVPLCALLDTIAPPACSRSSVAMQATPEGVHRRACGGW